MKKIYIDAGHGGKNPGATYNGRREADDVFRLASAVKAVLDEQPEIEAKLSRTADNDPEISRRTSDANAWKADYFISIHRNAFAPEKANGAEVWCYSKIEKGGETYKKAENILNALCAASGLKNRGIYLGAPSYTDFGVNRLTVMHSCLLEVGFVDSSADNALFDRNLQASAKAIAKALCEAVGVAFKTDSPLRGDVNGDWKVDVNDARTALRAAVGLEKLDDRQKKAADYDGDGEITVSDARDILRAATGIKEE